MVFDPPAVPSPISLFKAVSNLLSTRTPQRSLPRAPAPLAVVPMRLPSTWVPDSRKRSTPPTLPLTTLREAALLLLTVAPEAFSTKMPSPPLPSSLVPLLSVPMKLPSMRVPTTVVPNMAMPEPEKLFMTRPSIRLFDASRISSPLALDPSSTIFGAASLPTALVWMRPRLGVAVYGQLLGYRWQ